MTQRFIFFICTTFLTLLQSLEVTSNRQCHRITVNDFKKCVNHKKDIANNTHIEYPCKAEDLCKRNFNVSYVKLMPYYEMKGLIDKMLDFCCGTCATRTIVNEFFDISEANITSLATSDFIFPFLGPTSEKELLGFHFIPIIGISNAYYVTLKNTLSAETLDELINTCAELWPFLLTCLMLALISGFIAWVLDTWNNKEEFPRAFYVGVFEGFWWSFVSMTTVGYGDKVPKSWAARMFAVFWILTGITICSMFTATLTTAITSSITPKVPTIDGGKVGWLKYRMYEALIIAQYGGTLHEVKDDDYISGIKKLYELTSEKEIKGFLLDTLVFNKFKMEISDKEGKNYDKELAKTTGSGTTLTEVFNKCERLSFGILVKDPTHYDYFRTYFTDTRLQMKACNSFKLNGLIEEESTTDTHLFSIKSGLFWPVFYTNIGMLVLVACFGFIYEYFRRKHLYRQNEVGTKDTQSTFKSSSA